MKSFIETTNQEFLEKNPEYFVASTANFVAITEKFIKENYREPEQIIKKKIDEERSKAEKEGHRMLQDQAERAKTEPKDVNVESRKYQEKGYYASKMDSKEAEKITHGTFFYEKGKMFFGKAETREPVSYSNWYAGNVDPEELERHKEMLDRQHFGGPVWENRSMPKSVMDETFEEYLTGIQDQAPEIHPRDLGMTKETTYEKVKR